jgi:hypothetical protein
MMFSLWALVIVILRRSSSYRDEAHPGWTQRTARSPYPVRPFGQSFVYWV